MCAIKSFLARVRFVVTKRLIKNLGSLNKGKRVLKEGRLKVKELLARKQFVHSPKN
jgi:hypothetical protein